MSFEEQHQHEWLCAEYEMCWTTQSDVNARINTVYTAAMTISVALLGAIAVWAFAYPKADDVVLPSLLRALLFALPNVITLPMFLHNIGQRRSIVQLTAYWKVMIDSQAHQSTWASRVERYREVLGSNANFVRLRSEVNDPIPISYLSVYVASLSFAVGSCFLTNLPYHSEFGLLLLPVFGSIGVFAIQLTTEGSVLISTQS